MTIYNLQYLNIHSLTIMHQVHEYLVMRSQSGDWVGYEDINQFYATPRTGPSALAALLERVGIVYRAKHPSKWVHGLSKAIFFTDKKRLAQALDEIREEVATRETRPKRNRSKDTRADHTQYHTHPSMRETVKNLDFVNNLLKPKEDSRAISN